MRAAYYEQNGSAREVLRVGEVETPQAGPGEVRVKLATSGVNPSDVKSRQGSNRKIAWPRVIPHSDGAGIIDQVGDGVAASRIGERVWVYNGQWKRPFGTAAEYIALPATQAVRLPHNISFESGACLGIPAMTAYQAAGAGRRRQRHDACSYPAAPDRSANTSSSSPRRWARRCSPPSPRRRRPRPRARPAPTTTIDYKREDVGERVMEITGKRGVDAVIEMDLTANAKLIPAVLRPRGSVIVYGTGPEAVLPAAFCLVNTIRLQFFIVYELDSRRTRARGHRHHRRARRGPADQPRGEADLSRSPTSPPRMRRSSAARIGNVIVTL